MRKTGKIALIVIIAIMLLSLGGPFVWPQDPEEINLDSVKAHPSWTHPLGTDNKGRDVVARILYGAKISVGVAVVAAVLSMGIGLVVGVISGYAGGKVDIAIMAAVDLILSFPSLLLAIGVSVVLPPGVYTVMIALAAVGWASFARLIRGTVLVLRESTYIDAARALGCSWKRILFVHLIPQCIPLALVVAGVRLGGYVLTEAALSFLGLGAQPPTATWGSMVSTGRMFISSAPWMVIPPGLMIAVTALCFNIVGDELREWQDIDKDG